MERRATRTRTTLAVSMLALTLIAPWALGQDPDPITEIRRLAEKGDARAQLELGLMYANGEGVLKDDAEAVRWYRLAAEQGHGGAQNNLGLMCATGAGVAQDLAEAVKWVSARRRAGGRQGPIQPWFHARPRSGRAGKRC